MGDKNTYLEITLDSSLKVFMPGESVTGVVKYSTVNDQMIEIISVNFLGEYYFFREDEEFVHVFSSTSWPLDFKGAGEGTVKMPFIFTVQPDAPASIATPLGGIRYRLYTSLVCKKLNKLKNIEKSEYLTVIVPQQIKGGLTERKESVRERGLFSCCFGSVAGDLELMNTILLCGQSAVINACIINATNTHVLMTTLSLVQKIERRKDGKILKIKVSSKERGCIMPGKRQVWLGERFTIPPLPPTGSNMYFGVSYIFVMEIQKTATKTLKIKIPVAIGNVSPECKVLPTTWNNPGAGIEFWCSSLEESMKNVGFRPLYVSFITS